MVKFRHFLEKFYVAIIFVLLYLPIAVLTVMSFNNSRYMKWGASPSGGTKICSRADLLWRLCAIRFCSLCSRR